MSSLSLKRLYFTLILWLLTLATTPFGMGVILFSIILLFLMIFINIKEQPPVLSLFFFLFSYFVFFIYYSVFEVKLGPYIQYQSDYFYHKSLFIWLAFLSGFYLLLNKNLSRSVYDIPQLLVNNFKADKVIFYFFYIAAVILLIKLILGSENVIVASNKYQAYLSNLKTIGGASVIFFCVFIMAFAFSGGKSSKFHTLILFLLALLYLYFSITRGTRMLFVSMCFLLYVLYFFRKFNYKQVIGLMLLGFLLVLFINKLKHDVLASETLMNDYGQEYVLVNQAQILYGGAATVGAIEDDLLSLEDRVGAGIGLILESIVPPSLLPRNIKYPAILHDRVEFGGGGLFLYVVYIGFGYIGVFILGACIAVFISYVLINAPFINKWFILSFVMFLVLGTRWISYDFNIMYRLPLWFIVIGLIITSIQYRLSSKKICDLN